MLLGGWSFSVGDDALGTRVPPNPTHVGPEILHPIPWGLEEGPPESHPVALKSIALNVLHFGASVSHTFILILVDSRSEKVPQRTCATKILPNFRVNFLVRFASKPLLCWPVPSNRSEDSLVLFVRFFGFEVSFWPSIDIKTWHEDAQRNCNPNRL